MEFSKCSFKIYKQYFYDYCFFVFFISLGYRKLLININATLVVKYCNRLIFSSVNLENKVLILIYTLHRFLHLRNNITFAYTPSVILLRSVAQVFLTIDYKGFYNKF